MGEIDTKPIGPVQVALTLFGEKGDHQKKNRTSCSTTNEEMEKEKELESLLKDLANYKVQMDAKESAYSQLLLKLEHYQKVSAELSVQLKNSEAEKDAYVQECSDAKLRIDELESKLKEMANQLMEAGKLREQLWHVWNELKAVQAELLSIETELADADEAKLKALTQAELMGAAANMEKERAEELLKQLEELNEVIYKAKMAASESEKEKEIAIQALKEVEEMRKQLEMMQNLENQLLVKSVLIDSLQVELNQANELLGSSDSAVSEAINDLNQLKTNLQDKELESSDKAFYTKTLETELNRLQLELKNANEEASSLKSGVERLTDELHKEKTEMTKLKEAENEAQVEIALLKAELHKERSKLAAAKAAEARAGSVKSGLYLAVQQLGVEAEEAKKENERLKQGLDKPESNDSSLIGDNKPVESSSDVSQRDEANDRKITIPLKEYESLIKKAMMADQSPAKDHNPSGAMESWYEVEALKKELEAATAKNTDFRTRAEQAVTRAKVAEKAKLRLEDQINMWREHKQKRKAALVALREEVSSSRGFSTTTYEITHNKAYQPLGKILNMKF